MADYTNFDQAFAALNDPATSATDLQTIAQYQPRLYAKIAAHPAAYEGLLDWLASSGDPEVIAAVQARRQPQAAGPAPEPAPRRADPEPQPESDPSRHSGLDPESPTESETASIEVPAESSGPIPAEPSIEVPAESSGPIPVEPAIEVPAETSGPIPVEPSIEIPAEPSAPIPTEPSIPVPVEPTSPVSSGRIDPMGHPAVEYSGPVPPYAVPQQVPPGQGYPPPAGAPVVAVPPVPPKAPKPPSPFLTDSLGALKAVASLDPATAVVGAAEHKSPTGWAFGGLFALVSGVTGIALVHQLLNTVFQAVVGSFGGMGFGTIFEEVFPWWRVFLSGLVLGILSFLIWVGGAQLYRIIAKAKAPFTKTVNVVGTAFIPATAAMIIGALAGIAWAPIGLLIIIVGFFASAMLIFAGLNKVMDKPEGMVWPFVGIFAGVLALSVLAAMFVFNLFG